MNIKGKVHELLPEVQVSEKFKKQELIVEYAENPQYPEFIKLEAINERCALIADLAAGDAVDIDFNLKGKPWTNAEGRKQYFNQLVVWRVKTVSQSYEKVTPEYKAPAAISSTPDEDDLPF